MKFRPLGKTNLVVSEIGVGAWQLGGPLLLDGKTDGHPDPGREVVVKLIRDVAELGINFIDTAEQYGAGESERRVGEALEGQREHWIVATKFGAQVGPNGERINDVSAKRLPISLEGSLRRLRTDYIDLYFYHTSPDRNEAEAVAELLQKAKDDGKVRAVGISTNNLQDIEYLNSLGCLDVVQYGKNMMSPEPATTAWLVEHKKGCVVRGAFAGGRLSGRYFHNAPEFAPDDIRQRLLKPGVAEEFARYAVFEELVTAERGMIQIALRFLLDEPGTHTIIPGGKSLENYKEAVRATEMAPLTEAEKARIAELRAGILAMS